MYFDYNATHPVLREVLEQIEEIVSIDGNPSSPHSMGRRSKDRLEETREKVAAFLNCSHRDIYFTSGGTEANHLAILGYLVKSASQKKNILYSETEHPSVKGTLKLASRLGFNPVAVPVDSNGQVDLNILESKLSEACLATFMAANNETGVLHPVNKISELCKTHNVIFHSDWVQALGKVPFQSDKFHMASFSGHKLGALKGVGFLYKDPEVELDSMLSGGSQEKSLRPGTENLSGILSLLPTVKVWESSEELKSIGSFRDYFETLLKEKLPGVKIHGESAPRVCNTSCVSLPNGDAQSILFQLDLAGIQVSAGTACSSGAVKLSPVLLAMGVDAKEAATTLRFSFGRYNKLEEIDKLVELLCSSLNRTRRRKKR
jgi:cysteine desulfurase